MLLGAGFFQDAPQHIPACWEDSLVIICNWKFTLLLLLSDHYKIISPPVMTLLKELIVLHLNTVDIIMGNQNT